MKRINFLVFLFCAFSLSGFCRLFAAGPDLVITDIWVDGNRIHYQIQNIGSLACPGHHETYLEIDGSYRTMDTIASSLSRGERLNSSFSKEEFNCTGIQQKITAIADGGGDITELKETNNTLKETYVCDQTPPEITEGPTVTEYQPGSVKISWKTGEDADSEVLYGQNAGEFSTVSDQTQSQDHLIYLDSLQEGAVFCYQVRSTDESGNTVKSRLQYFATSPPQDTKPPVASEPRKRKTDQPLFPLRFDMEAEDDNEMDRVEFSYDGAHFMTDYDAPYSCYVLPDELDITFASFFGQNHSVLAEAYDQSDNLTTINEVWAELPRCVEMELEVHLCTSTTVYTPDEEIHDYSGDIRIVARKNDGLLLIPGEGPHPAHTGIRWAEVDEVRVYFDGSLMETLTPAEDETTLTFTLNIASLSAPSLHEVKVEIQTDACVIARRATMEVVRQLVEVTAERTVTRDGTGFEVAIVIENEGTTTAYLDYLSEEAEGFQITCPDSSLYDATVAYNPGTRSSTIEYDFNCSVSAGGSRTFRYTAIPILSEGVSDYRLGENNAFSYHDAFGKDYDSEPLAETGLVDGCHIGDEVDDACEESDYLIVTNPALLFGIHDSDAVNLLLAKIAELADVRNAVLGYYLGAGSVRTAFRSSDKIGCGNILGNWKDEIVIMDESDNVIRVYNPNRQRFIESPDDLELPIPVSGLHSDDVLLVGNLLADADPSHPEDEIAIVDGHSSGGARGDVVLFDYRPDHDDFVQDTNDTVYDPSDGDQIIVGDMIYQAAAPDADEMILFDGESGEVAAYYGNAPVHRHWDSVYEPGDLVAAGDLIASIDGDEIVIGDFSAQRIYIYSGTGAVQHQFAYSFEQSDRFQVSDEGLAIADSSADRVYVRGIGVGSDRAVGDFDVNVHTSDAFVCGHVIEHGSPQYLFARGHREDHFTHGDVEIFPYSGSAGGSPGDRDQLDVLLSPGGEWAEKMGDNFIDGGYLLIVGETEIIPAFACSYDLAGNGTKYVEFTDNYYSNTSGEMKKPEISAGRIVGNHIDRLMVPIQTSLDVASGDKELNFAEAYCFSGDERRHETARDDVIEALEDKGWHVESSDEPSEDTIYLHTEDIDALYMAAHGYWDHCWRVDKDNVESRFEPGRTAPLVFAASCLTGEYPASSNTLAERFLKKGASAYIGATEVSYSPYNRYLSEGFFEGLEFDSPIGDALKDSKRNRMGDGDYGKYQSAIYHFFGDPKLEALSSKAMADNKATKKSPEGAETRTIRGPVGTLQVSIPTFTVEETADGDVVSIPGGTVLAEPGQPEVPAWPVDVYFSKGTIVQDIELNSAEYTSGTDIDLVVVQPEADGEIHPGPALPDADAWPDRQYDWSTEAAPDGGAILTVWIYPFRTWPASTNYTFLTTCTLDIDYSSTPVVVNRLRTDPRICAIGDTVTIEMFVYNTSQQATDVIAEAVLTQNGAEDNSIGLPIKNLKNLKNLASFSWTLDTAQVTPDIYDIHVRVKTTDGQLLAEESTAIQIGTTDGITYPVEADPPAFEVGEDIKLLTGFENTGQVSVNLCIVLEIQDLDGNVIERFEDTATDLAAGGVYETHWEWDPTVAYTDCQFVAYTLFDGKTTPVESGVFKGYYFYVMPNLGDCPGGAACFSSIADAMGSVSEDGTVLEIMPGDYSENVVVNKTATLVVQEGRVGLRPGSEL